MLQHNPGHKIAITHRLNFFVRYAADINSTFEESVLHHHELVLHVMKMPVVEPLRCYASVIEKALALAVVKKMSLA